MRSNLKDKTKGRLGLIFLAFIAFIALGLPDGLLGVGWPSIRAGFSIPLDSLGMLLFTGMTGYLAASFFNGKLISWLGVGGLLAASCGLTGATLICYTLVPQWWMMVALGITAGLGAGAIDAGLNTYVAANFSEGLMQWLHASYGIGITLGPIIMTVGLNTLNSWRMGYTIVGIFQIVLAICFLFTLPQWKSKKVSGDKNHPKRMTDYNTPYTETFLKPRVWLSALLFFLYTGAEVSLGAWAYTLLTESRSIDPNAAGLWTGSYWATFTVGRVLAGLYTRRISNHTIIRGSLSGALIGVVLLWWNPSDTISLIGIGMIGLAIAPVFPALMSGTSQRVGSRFAVNTIGMQMSAACIGSAAIPGLIGVLAKQTSLEVIPVCLFVLFAVMLVGYSLSMLVKKQPDIEVIHEIPKVEIEP
jgi:fucose permease